MKKREFLKKAGVGTAAAVAAVNAPYVKAQQKSTIKWRLQTYAGGLDELRQQIETANVSWDVVDFELADWNEVSGYYRKLAAESQRVRVETVGETTEGREFLLAIKNREDQSSHVAFNLAYETVYPDHPYGMTGLGEKESSIGGG